MKGIRYIHFMLALLVSVSMWGQYNPTNPAEPGIYYTLSLQATPSNGGSFNLNTTTTYSEGTRVSIRAYTNTNYTFVGWEMDGEIYSTSSSITYIMPARNVKLIALYKYTPSSPAEPSEPQIPVYSTLFLEASPAAGGYFNINSGNKHEVGTTVSVRAYSNSNYVFKNWTEDGVVVSTTASFNYTMKSGNPKLTANYVYNPSTPSEPQEPVLTHKLYLKSNPAAGGYFNISSGNSHSDGSSVYLCAYSNQWYSFENWTDENGEVISTSNSFNYTMPSKDNTLTANYSYKYNPSNPGEPSEPTDNGVNIYGMTESGIRSQQIAYPIHLENSIEVKEMKVDMQFPESFVVNTEDIRLASRAIGHDAEVTDLGDNTFRIYIKGDLVFSGNNGKLFEVLVTIPQNAVTALCYPVTLTHGIIIGTDGSQTSVSVRSGNIFVTKVSEDGLYARFGFDKLLNRVQFNNMSSDKAVSYEWDFGDGSTSTEPNPMHVYETPGLYDVALTSYGNSGEDVAQMTVLVNDSTYWNVGGTLVLSSQKGNVRHFESIESLLSLVSAADIIENLTIGVQAGENYSIAATDENVALFEELDSRLREKGLSLNIKTIGEGDIPVFALGETGDSISDRMISVWNSLGETTLSSDVLMMLCGIDYNPSAIHDIADQTINSGDNTKEMNLQAISNKLTFTWEQTTEYEEDSVLGSMSEGSGNIPSMIIDNVNLESVTLVYHIVGTYNERQFCDFEKMITVLPGTSVMSQEEWDNLLQLRQELILCGWQSPWDMSGGREGELTFEGVEIERGHVVGLDLSNQSLHGEIPASAFTFPRLTSLSLANNNFMGDIGSISSIEGISSRLETLDVSYNSLSEVSVKLPQTIKILNLCAQAPDLVLELDVNNIDVAATVSRLPSIFRYDHAAQTWSETPKIRLTDYCPATPIDGAKWEMILDATGEETVVSCPSSSNVYRGQNGDSIYVSYPSASTEVKNSYCLATFTFSDGDVNFSGNVEVDDLQTMVLYMFGEYSAKPFNFTAANLYKDGTVNVQDIIRMVSLLLDSAVATSDNRTLSKAAGVTGSDVCLYIIDNIVYMDATKPIAAIHIASNGDIDWDFNQYGLTQSSNSNGVVAYSLNGMTMPTGMLKVGCLNGEGGVLYASASDVHAKAVGVSFVNHDTTGIKGVSSDMQDDSTYAIDGTRSQKSHKGIIIEKRNNRHVKVIKK